MITFPQIKAKIYPTIQPVLDPIKRFCDNDIPLQKSYDHALAYLQKPEFLFHIAALACAKEEGLKTLIGASVGVLAAGMYTKFTKKTEPDSDVNNETSVEVKSEKPIEVPKSILDKLVDSSKGISIEMRIIAVAGIILVQLLKVDFLELKTITAFTLGGLYGQHLLMKLQ